jgi:hypothetical protein
LFPLPGVLLMAAMMMMMTVAAATVAAATVPPIAFTVAPPPQLLAQALTRCYILAPSGEGLFLYELAIQTNFQSHTWIAIEPFKERSKRECRRRAIYA